MTLDDLKRELWKNPEFRRAWRRMWPMRLRGWIAVRVFKLSGLFRDFANWLICWGTDDCNDDDYYEVIEDVVINYFSGDDIPREWRRTVEIRE